jgi:hypothetical protein
MLLSDPGSNLKADLTRILPAPTPRSGSFRTLLWLPRNSLPGSLFPLPKLYLLLSVRHLLDPSPGGIHLRLRDVSSLPTMR